MSGGARRHRTHLVHKSAHKAAALHSDINVTPLVDVCLCLLIIFMVIMPMLQRGKEVPLPTTRHHDCQNPTTEEEKKACADKQQPIVAIDMDHRTGEIKYYVGTDEVAVGPVGDPQRFSALRDRVQRDWDDLKQKLDASSSAGAGNADGLNLIFLKVNGEVPYGKVRPVILSLHDMGVAGIDLGTNEAKDK